jgi:hypothetical protein
MHNSGRYLGFIEPSDCHMGGHIIQLLRVLCLRAPITEAGNLKVVLDVSKKFHFIAKLVRNDVMWDYLFCLSGLVSTNEAPPTWQYEHWRDGILHVLCHES